MDIIYGLGNVGQEFVKKITGMGAFDIALTDANEELWNQELFGLPIQSPEEAFHNDYEKVIVSVGNISLFLEIKSILIEQFHIKEEKIVWYEFVIILCKDQPCNLGDIVLKEHSDKNRLITIEDMDSEKMNNLERFFFYEKHKKIHKILHYFEAYDRYFSRYRGKDIVILEIGVSGGGSLQMWKNYFKTACNTVQIYGIDINPACKALEEENIKIYIGSQEDRDFLRMIKNEIGKVDILIDDGGHTMSQQIITFEELFDIVADDGVYLCEDTCTSYMSSFGGGYRCNSFIEYAKSKIDDIHAFYSETNELKPNHYSKHIKSISYFDSMVFFEKKQESGELCFFWTENK